jgi:hypothetical protein
MYCMTIRTLNVCMYVVVITLTLWSSIACVHVMVQTEHSSELVFVKTGRPARKKTRALCGQGVDPMRQSYSYNNMPHDWSSVLQDVDTGGPAKAPHQFLVTRSMEFTCPLSQQPPADGWCQPRDVADVLVVWVHNLSMEQYGHHSSTAIIITKQAWKSLYVFFVDTVLMCYLTWAGTLLPMTYLPRNLQRFMRYHISSLVVVSFSSSLLVWNKVSKVPELVYAWFLSTENKERCWCTNGWTVWHASPIISKFLN